MGFLLLSVEYPSKTHKTKYLRQAGPHSNFASPLHKPLAASATDDQWRNVLKAIRNSSSLDSSFLYDQSSPRPLKPNDDNYEAFSGKKWEPECAVTFSNFRSGNRSVNQALSALMGQDIEKTPYPRYSHCANCTKIYPEMKQCSRCKIVKYCSRDCQSSHWKKVHKKSCTKAVALPLYKIMNGNDGFYVSSEECRVLHLALSRDRETCSDEVIHCFQAYFGVAADLGGCFVL